ncbi:MAG: DUF3833 domain-containing protein [Ectothiorhodospiraceae bacterium]|nr:DUF3833 domain-containing protein [Ectothiorhodospiraceae bacterium]
MIRLFIVLSLSLVLAGCAAVSVDDYRDDAPELVLEEYFDGELIAHGLFVDRFGRVQRRFVVTIDAWWEGNVGTLDERFHYDDGTTDRRVWTLRRLPDGTYNGRAADVAGVGRIQVAGNTMRLRYTLMQPIGGRVWNVSMDDWMHLIDNDTLVNRTRMSKFGITLGHVIVQFRRLDGESDG